ncbi:MAG: HyaD/HybD family hydrogenase maturation endopeptidase [Enterobacteriaceae bacterium]
MARIVVLGLGNLLWADEGFGVRVAERLFPCYHETEDVAIIDGGTQGLALLPYIQPAEKLLIVDAVDFAMVPGTLIQCRNEQVPAYLSAKKLSLHQTGFAEVLGLLQLLGGGPQEIVLIGVQPCFLEDYGGSLTEVVRAQLVPATELAQAILSEWGVSPGAGKRAARLNHPGLEISRYESERPDSSVACRFGDERVLWGGK